MPLTFRSAWQTSPFAPTLPHMLFPYPSSQPLLNYLRPLKIWPQKWEGCPMCGLATAGVIPWHLCDLSASFLGDIPSQWLVRSFLALIHLQSSCISQWTAAPADLAMVGFLSTRKGQGVLHLWYMTFLFVGISFLFYPVETWNLIFNHYIISSSPPSTWDVKKEYMRLAGQWGCDLEVSGSYGYPVSILFLPPPFHFYSCGSHLSWLEFLVPLLSASSETIQLLLSPSLWVSSLQPQCKMHAEPSSTLRKWRNERKCCLNLMSQP